jgi:hypothetical protein
LKHLIGILEKLKKFDKDELLNCRNCNYVDTVEVFSSKSSGCVRCGSKAVTEYTIKAILDLEAKIFLLKRDKDDLKILVKELNVELKKLKKELASAKKTKKRKV